MPELRQLRPLRELRVPRVQLRKTVDLSLPPELIGRTAAVYERVVDLTAEAITDDLRFWLRQNFRADADYPGDLEAMLARVRAKFPPGAVDIQLTSIARAVDELSFDKLVRVPGVNPARILPTGVQELNRFRQVNAALITSVPVTVAQDVAAVLAEPDVRGLHVNDIAKILEERFGVSKSRARFWARDQTLKLYARLQETRQRAAGATRYQWEHSGDERVRGRPEELGGIWWRNASNHWLLGNTIQSWDLPPITNPKTGARNHPGHDHSCRCTAYPLFDGDPIEVQPPAAPSSTPAQEAAELLRATQLPPPDFSSARR